MKKDSKTRSTAEKRTDGRSMGKDTIENAKPIDVEVSIDGEPLNEDVLFIEALNVPMIGPHLRLGETPHDAGPEFDVGWLPARDAELFIEWLGGRAEAKPAPLQRMRAKQLLLTLSDGRRLQALTVVDAYTREALRIEVDQGIKGEQVVFVMGEIAAIRGVPKTIRVDNGPEFVSKALDRWAYENGVTLDSSRPGKPTDNAFVESFNGKFRAECLDAHRFLSLDDARGQDRGLAAGLQRELPSHVPGLADAQRIRLIGRGQTPANEARSLTLRPDKIQEDLIGNSISATLILIT